MTIHAALSLEQIEAALETALPRIVRVMEARLRDKSLAEESATDSVSAAWEQWRHDPAYFACHDLVRWATQRADWRATDALRRRARSVRLAEEHPADEDGARTADAPALAQPDGSAREALQRLVYDSVRQLKPLERTVLEGMAYDNLTDQAMGTALYGEADGTAQARGLRVFRRRQRALIRLGQLLRARGIASWAEGLAV